MANYWRYYAFPTLLGITTVLLYFIFAYHLVRTDFFILIILYGALFLLFYLLIKTQGKRLNFLLISGIVFRLVFLIAIPNLSQDFYRFIWDGELVLKGMSPYLYRPDHLIDAPDFSMPNMQVLYEGMGDLSASHYSNYPPLNQLIFAFSSVFSDTITGTVVTMRTLIILADIGVLYFGKKLLTHLKLPKHYILWYLLNPLVIIELSGNLHFEGVMLFFILWSLYLLFRYQLYRSAFLFACAVSIKLIPLLFLPLFLQRLGWKKIMVYGTLVMVTLSVMFLPFLSEAFLEHYKETIGLWFTNFEFNASWYYGIREIGYAIKGYNIITSYGRIMPWVVLLFIIGIAFFRKNKTPIALISAMVLALSFYYFTSTTVHPWYIITAIGISIFTKYRFPIVWSLVIVLSYAAYSVTPFRENLWWIAVEYSVVYGLLVWEIFFKKPLFIQEPMLKE